MAKLNQIEVNGTTYDLQDKSIFTGTKSEVNSAISNGTIKEGDIVNITDDAGENSGGGGSSNIIYLTQEAYDALPESKLTNGVEYRITDANTSTTVARNIAYDNSESGIEAVNVQGAIDKVSESLGDISNIGNDNYNSVEKLLRYYIDNGYLPDINNVALVPTMTSNTSPSGVVSASSEVATSERQAYKAFDGNDTTRWAVETTNSTDYLQYKFASPVVVKKIEHLAITANKYTVKASNDGTTWTDLCSITCQQNVTETFNVPNNNAYLYYRLAVDTSLSTTRATISTLQFYGIK